MATDIFSEVDPPIQNQRPRHQAIGVFAITYDIIQVWSVSTSRLEISDRLLRQPVTSLTRFPARPDGTRPLDVGVTLEPPPNPSSTTTPSINSARLIDSVPENSTAETTSTYNTDPTASPELLSTLPSVPATTTTEPLSQVRVPDIPSGVLQSPGLTVASPSIQTSQNNQSIRQGSRYNFIDLTGVEARARRGDEDDIPYELIVESMGLRVGEPHVQFPVDIDGLDSPDNVVASLRLGSQGQKWFPSREDRCYICMEPHSSTDPLYYTPCGHTFHQPCWNTLRIMPETHPHQRRLDGNFRRDGSGGPILDLSLTKCPSCRSYVSNDTIGCHAEGLVVPYDPFPRFQENYSFCVGRTRGIEIHFTNRKVIQQPPRSSERSGAHSGHCGPLAVFNVDENLSNRSTIGPQVEAHLERTLLRWRNQIENGTLPNSSNLDPAGIHSYISNGGLTAVANASVHVWCPTVTSGTNIQDALRTSLVLGTPLGLVANNGNHWFGSTIRRVDDSRIEIAFMEPWDDAIQRSVQIMRTHLLPQLLQAIEYLVPPPLRLPSQDNQVPSAVGNSELNRSILTEQNEEFAQSLVIDEARSSHLAHTNSAFLNPESTGDSAELARNISLTMSSIEHLSHPTQFRTDGSAGNVSSVTDSGSSSNQATSRRRRDDYWHTLNSGETPDTPPPRTRGNRRAASDSDNF